VYAHIHNLYRHINMDMFLKIPVNEKAIGPIGFYSGPGKG